MAVGTATKIARIHAPFIRVLVFYLLARELGGLGGSENGGTFTVVTFSEQEKNSCWWLTFVG
jgi:hypothetical protein